MKETQTEIPDFSKIREKLIRGDVKAIADKTEKSRNHVRNVLTGMAIDHDVVKCALEIIEARANEAHQLNERLKNLRA